MLEVCIDSVDSAENAQRGGARRVELCANLAEGGTTPSIGMLKVLKQVVSVPVFVMIRPRGGDFLYTGQEMAVMKEDISALKAAGANGIVLGILTSQGSIDVDKCQELIDLARPLPVTFHRAIDMTIDIESSLEEVIRLGCERVLTSGGENSALEGAPVIRRLVEQAGSRIIVMPGGGITDRNVRRLLDETGAQEFHASARCSQSSQMVFQNSRVRMGATYGPPEFSYKSTDKDRVRGLVKASKEGII